jgi:hypothetical protein
VALFAVPAMKRQADNDMIAGPYSVNFRSYLFDDPRRFMP